MSETISRSSPHTGTVLPEGRPFWIVDGKAYDLTEWMALHPGGATWFKTTQGRDISALLHTYHRDPLKLRKILARYEIEGFTERDVLPKLGIPPFLLAPDFDASVDLPRLDYRDDGSLLAAIRLRVNAKLSKAALRRNDRLFDVVTCCLGLLHVAALGLMVTGTLAWWVCVLIMVVTRTALAGAGHYHLHRKWSDRGRFTFPIGKALFDINYVGTSLIGTDGHVLLHHPYLGSGADVKKTFFDRMLRLHPVLRIPGYTLHKFGICLLGLPLRAREIGKFEHPRTGPAQDGGLRGLLGFLRGGRRSSGSASASAPASESGSESGSAPARKAGEAIRADFWTMRVWMVLEFALCAATGYIVPWIIQFVITLWFNTFLVVASHDFEEAAGDDELDVIPPLLRDDWAARQICLSYDLSIAGNRWIDLWLSAGLSPHRVHHVLPFQGSGFANLVSESAVREACAEVGIAWERPRNLIFNRFPVVIKHYLLAPVMAGPPPMFGPPPPGIPPPPGMPPVPGMPPPGAPSLGPPPAGASWWSASAVRAAAVRAAAWGAARRRTPAPMAPAATGVAATREAAGYRPRAARRAGPLFARRLAGRRRLTLQAGRVVDLLAKDVGVPGVPPGLLDHVRHDPAQRHLARLPRVDRPGHRAQVRAPADDLVAARACPPVSGHHIGGADVVRDLHRPRHGQVFAEEDHPEPVLLHTRQVLDQAEDVRPRRHARGAQLLLGQPFRSPDHGVPHLVQEMQEHVELGIIHSARPYASAATSATTVPPQARRPKSTRKFRATRKNR